MNHSNFTIHMIQFSLTCSFENILKKKKKGWRGTINFELGIPSGSFCETLKGKIEVKKKGKDKENESPS